MSNHCMVTGAFPRSGNHVSHSHKRTKRRFMPNIQHKRYWLPSENRFVRLTVSAHGIKVIDARGIERVVRDIRARGVKV
jgi:large subunit ribosomal protein L28